MGYMDLNNLYKNQDVLLFKECYALEKVHGSSAHVGFKRVYDQIRVVGQDCVIVDPVLVNYFAGGESHERFKSIFDEPKLKAAFEATGLSELVIYGEVYGGRCQGMKDTYGESLAFIAFDVLVGEDRWLSVPAANDITKTFELEFVPWNYGPTTLEWLDGQRDLPSRVAKLRGITEDKQSEGIVIRPPIEVKKNNGQRIMAKHKTAKFRETKTPREVDDATLKVLSDAEAVASEWIVEMRLQHVLSHLNSLGNAATELKDTGRVATAMLEDVRKESAGEIVWSPEVEKAIKRKAAEMYKSRATAVKS